MPSSNACGYVGVMGGMLVSPLSLPGTARHGTAVALGVSFRVWHVGQRMAEGEAG